MHVASGMDIRPCSVDGRVDDKAGGIDLVRCRLHGSSVVVDEDQVARLHLGKMLRVWVDPEPLGVDGVSQTDVS